MLETLVRKLDRIIMLHLYMKNTTIILFLSLIILITISILPLIVFREGNKNKKNKKNKKKHKTHQAPTQCMNEDTCNAFVRANKGAAAAAATGAVAAADTGSASSAAGTSYNYASNIKIPAQMGITDAATMTQIGKDVEALIEYVGLLIEGTSSAGLNPGGGPMGNKFFVKTPGKCNDIKTSTEQDRYLYINNIPTGSIPLSNSPDVNFTNFRGLIPGMMTNMDVFNPSNIANALLVVGNPDCMKITMDTVDVNNVAGNESNYVTLSDISELDPCLFPADASGNKMNPQTKLKCVVDEGFATIDEEYTLNDAITDDIKNDYIAQLFLGSFSLFSVYLLFKLLHKITPLV